MSPLPLLFTTLALISILSAMIANILFGGVSVLSVLFMSVALLLLGASIGVIIERLQ